MLRSFHFSTLSRGNQRPNLPYKKALGDIFGGIVYITFHWKLCHFATGLFASKHRHFCNNTFTFYKYLFRTSCNNRSSANKSVSYLHIIVCCCGLEFQFLNTPKRFLLGRHVPHSTFPTHHRLWDTTHSRQGKELFLLSIISKLTLGPTNTRNQTVRCFIHRSQVTGQAD
jgi:hypothetical protein